MVACLWDIFFYLFPVPCFNTIIWLVVLLGQPPQQQQQQLPPPQQQQQQQRGSESQGKYSKPLQKDEDEGLEEEEEDEHGETLCGACGENYASDEFWICCDICEKWFHGKCVKITPARAEHIKQYKCPSCSNKRSRPWYIKLIHIWCFHPCTLLSGSSLTAFPVRFLPSSLPSFPCDVFSRTCELNCCFSFWISVHIVLFICSLVKICSCLISNSLFSLAFHTQVASFSLWLVWHLTPFASSDAKLGLLGRKIREFDS